MQRGEILKLIILRGIGNFLVLFAIFGVVATFGPSLYFEVHYRIVQARGVSYVVSDPTANQNVQNGFGEILNKQKENNNTPPPSGFSNIISSNKEQILIPKDTQFSILIPKIGANSKVFPNVDSAKQNEFLPILQKGVAHAKGTVFPGMTGNIYLFAHSTDNFWDVGRYNAVFYLLKDLTPGDDIVIFFDNKRFNYVVSESKIVDNSDISTLVKSQEQGSETLILQTCWPPGTTWKRLLVLAKPK